MATGQGPCDIALLYKEIDYLKKRNKELENYIKQVELKNLFMQIKPHFIFNTLNIIARLILLNRNAEAMDITYAFSKLLRFNLEKKDLVRLYEELQHVRNYLLIQKSRYQEKLEVKLDIAESILISLVPPLILQPVIENAISHGLEPNGGGKIIIHGQKKENKVLLAITDNGRGFPAIIRDNILEQDNARKDIFEWLQTLNNIGLINIQKRIALTFGNEYGLKINSEPNRGTEVSILLPFNPDINNEYTPSFWFD